MHLTAELCSEELILHPHRDGLMSAQLGEKVGKKRFFPALSALVLALQSFEPLTVNDAIWRGLSNACGFTACVLHICIL